MNEPKITPQAVKKIESALEERKTKRDRRGTTPAPEEAFDGSDRRKGIDRRDLDEK